MCGTKPNQMWRTNLGGGTGRRSSARWWRHAKCGHKGGGSDGVVGSVHAPGFASWDAWRTALAQLVADANGETYQTPVSYTHLDVYKRQ